MPLLTLKEIADMFPVSRGRICGASGRVDYRYRSAPLWRVSVPKRHSGTVKHTNPRIIATTVTSSGAKMTQRSSHGEALQSSDGAGRLIPYLSPIEFYLDPRIPIVLHFHPQKRSWVNSSILLSCRATDGSRDILLINCIKDFSTHFVRSQSACRLSVCERNDS